MATTSTQTQKPKTGSTNMSNRAIRPGYISHTEFASTDPKATRTWCEKVLGWEFSDPVPTPNGPYHMWRHETDTGGGIRSTNKGEPGNATPYVEVSDINATWKAALKAGAKEMMPPAQVPGEGGWIAICQIPGGAPVGFWSKSAK